MRIAPVLIVSSDSAWRAQVADTLIAADLMVYCARGMDEAIQFLLAGVEPTLVVLDGRRPQELERYAWAERKNTELQRFAVVTVDADPRPAHSGALPERWRSVEGAGVGSAIAELLTSRGSAPG